MASNLKLPELLFEELIKPQLVRCTVDEFKYTVISISKDLGINPNWLMAVIELETAHTFDPQITNGIGAVGLIQFTPRTAKRLGTTPGELRKMDGIRQLAYVRDYLWPYREDIHSLTDCYCAVFFPLALEHSMTWHFHTPGMAAGMIAAANPLFDPDGDGFINKSMIKAELYSHIKPAKQHLLKK